MKLENKAVWEGGDDLMSSIQKKACEYIDPSKQSYMGIKESFNGKKNVDRCTEAPFTISAGEIKLGENETDFCTDKTVTEIQPPEMIGCYKDGASLNIKDICVDEGICSLEKVLVENDQSSQRFPSSFNDAYGRGNGALSKEMADDNTSTVHDSKSASNEHLISVEKNAMEHHFSGSLSKVGAKFDTTNPFISDISSENVSLKQCLPLYGFETDSQQVETTNVECSSDHKHDYESFSNVGGKFRASNPFLSDISDEMISFKQFLSLQELETDSLQVEPTNFDLSNEQLADHQKFDQGTLEEYSTTSVVPSDARQPTQSNGSKENASICLSQGAMEDGYSRATSSSSDDGESEQCSGIKESPAKGSSEDRLKEGCSVATSASYDISESEESSGIKKKPAKSLSQGLLKDVSSQHMAMPSDAKESNQSSGTMGNPANAELESGVSGLASVGGHERKEKIDTQQDGQAKNDPVTEEAVSDNATTSARSSLVHYYHLDADFSEPVNMSGPIASSGHIPYSGSISLRSDSSTTSTRSFAFPILQSEWNSSPVKMAKADRRHLRKHRGWWVGLLCCRF